MTVDERNFLDLCKASLLLHEGKLNRVYLDTKGHPTIGIGFNLDRRDATEALAAVDADALVVRAGGQELSDAQVFALLEADLKRCLTDARNSVADFSRLSPVRQLVLIDMIYNLGLGGFLGFTKMLSAIQMEYWADAAREMLDSRWAMQVKTRAIRLSEMMTNDVLSPDVINLLPLVAGKSKAVGKAKHKGKSKAKSAARKKKPSSKKKTSSARKAGKSKRKSYSRK